MSVEPSALNSETKTSAMPLGVRSKAPTVTGKSTEPVAPVTHALPAASRTTPLAPGGGGGADGAGRRRESSGAGRPPRDAIPTRTDSNGGAVVHRRSSKIGGVDEGGAGGIQLGDEGVKGANLGGAEGARRRRE